MNCEHIRFVMERITDILKLDRERNQILNSYSPDKIKEVLKFYKELSRVEKWEIKELQKVYEEYSDDERNIFLKMLERNEKNPVKVRKVIRLRKRQFGSDELKKSFNLFRDFSPLEKYPKLCERLLQHDVVQPLFELIFLIDHDEDKDIVLSDHVRKEILKLSEELKGVLRYLGYIEANPDKQELKQGYHQFCWELSDVANRSDEILDHVFRKGGVASDIQSLIEKIHKSKQLPQIQYIINMTIKDNTNNGHTQMLGNATFSYGVPGKPPRRTSRPNSYGHVPNTHVVGFKDEIDTLFNHLTKDGSASVVGIVGMGGSGKTTLAKHIYHNPLIMTKFSCRVWVCISQSWDKTNILNKIWIQAAADANPKKMDYDALVSRLFKLLSSQSCLVILDDIWSIDAWYDIYPILPLDSGTKVVVTTRLKFLPQRLNPKFHIIEPKRLNDIESYALFESRVSLLNESIPQNLLQLGKDMIKKCRGLPLAIIALAGVLMENQTESNWERLKRKMLDISNDSTQGVVKEILKLSYHELPSYLKPCVHYLLIFPEDYEIKVSILVKLWIAECLISSEDPVYTAKDCLEQIVRRCIVDVVERNCMGEVKKFRIHDLVREMIIDKDTEIFKNPLRLVPITTTQYNGEQKYNSFFLQFAHADADEQEYTEILQRMLGSRRYSHARSLVILKTLGIAESISRRLFVEFRLLRVLIFPFRGDIPEEIGNLIHLRYLKLSWGYLTEIPMFIGNLTNLWTLDMRRTFVEKWDNGALNTFYKLKELRHLYLPDSNYLELNWPAYAGGPKHINLKETKLKTLYNVRGGQWMLSDMLEFSDVLEKLRISDIMSNQQLEAIFKTPSITSNNLHTLELFWGKYGRWGPDPELCTMDILQVAPELCDMSILGECKSLKKLTLEGKVRVASSIVLPPGLIKLEMASSCLEEREMMNIISKSCPQLRILVLRNNAYMGTELVCNSNSFPQLERLTLHSVVCLKMWIIEESAMPKLHHLTIKNCQHLNLNPQGWRRISKIPKECRDLSSEFEDKIGLDLSLSS